MINGNEIADSKGTVVSLLMISKLDDIVQLICILNSI